MRPDDAEEAGAEGLDLLRHPPTTDTPGQVEQEHIALLKKRFRFASLSPTS